jgi:uncharacterized Zn-binding protein involved in type VI secretion
MSEVLRVARVEDPIGHTYRKIAVMFGTTVGLAVGIGIAYITRGRGLNGVQHGIGRTLGRGLQEGGGLIGTANSLSTMASDAIGRVTSGKIQDGARRTWTEDKRNARITDPVECGDPPGTQLLGLTNPIFAIFTLIDAIGNALKGGWPGEHVDAKIENGSQTVFVEDRNASRLTEKTTCEGRITSAASRTWFGGPSVTLAGYEGGSEEGSTIAGIVYGLDWTLNLTGRVMDMLFQDPVKRALGAARSLARVYGEAHPEHRQAADRVSNALEWVGLAYDLRPSSSNTGRQNAIKAATTAIGGARAWNAPAPTPPPTRIVRYPS